MPFIALSATTLAATLLGLTLAASCGTGSKERTPEPGPGPGAHSGGEDAATRAPAAIPEKDVDVTEPVLAQEEPPPGTQPGRRMTRTPVIKDATVDAEAKWTTYRIGDGSFEHPPEWAVQPSAYGLVLIPEDHRANNEIISITATDAAGIRSASDVRIGRTLDGLVAASMPGLRRTGRPTKIDAGQDRQGARYDYEGIATDGRPAVASAYIVVESERAAAISLVADPDTMAMRRPTIARIFRSFSSSQGRGTQGEGAAAPPEGRLDPRLIGMFGGESIHSGEGVYLNTQLVYALGSDGIIHHGARSHINASQRDSSGGFRWTATGQSGGSSQRGTWTSQNGFVQIRWDKGGTSSFAYGFEPDGTLALRHPVTRKLINFYSRIQ